MQSINSMKKQQANQNQNKQQLDWYKGQNQILKQMHLARLKRLKQQNLQLLQENQSQCLKQIKTHDYNSYQKANLLQTQKEQLSKKSQQIWLNSLIYDKRKQKPKCMIKLPTLLQDNPFLQSNNKISSNIQCILITTYGFQMQVFKTLAESTIPFYVVNHTNQNGEGRVQRNYNGYNNMTLVIPKRTNKGYGVFHIKMWLLKFKDFLRVVIGTGNNHIADWTLWSNAYWYQDFALIKNQKQKQLSINISNLKQQEKKKNNEEKFSFDYNNDFKETIQLVIDSMLPKQAKQQIPINLDDYKFQNIEVILIPTIPGRHTGAMLNRIGIGKLKHVINKYSKHYKNPTLTYNSTSLGVLQENFIRQLYNAFIPSCYNINLNNFHLIYPTKQYIEQKTCGEAQVLFLTNKNYQNSTLKKNIFYQYEPSKINYIAGNIPHLKVAIIQPQIPSQSCMLYVGSHNLTKAAWGTLEKNNSQIFTSNSELGLLFLEYSKQQLMSWLPFQYPPNKYSIQHQPYLKDMN